MSRIGNVNRGGACKARVHTKGMDLVRRTNEHLHAPDEEAVCWYTSRTPTSDASSRGELNRMLYFLSACGIRHHSDYSTTSIIRTLINRTFRLSEHGHKSHTYTTMYKSASFIRTVTYPNSFVRSQRVRIIEVALYLEPLMLSRHGIAPLILTMDVIIRTCGNSSQP